MLLAVAGLNDRDIDDRIAKLAAGDWSSFAPSDRAELLLAHQLARRPWAIGPAERATLAAYVGPERALATIWYIGWCHYMTRVADAFQIPLERENVFMEPKPPEVKSEK